MTTELSDVVSFGASATAVQSDYAPAGPITSVVDGGNAIVGIASYDSSVGIVDVNGGRHRLGHHDHLVNHITSDAGGVLFATSSSDYTVRLWNVAQRRLVVTLRGHDDDVEAFTFLGKDRGVSASRDGFLIVWNLAGGSVERVLRGHDSDVLSVSTDGRRIFSSGDDMTLRVWNADRGELTHTFGPFTEETDTCDVDARRQRAVLGCDDGAVRVFDIEKETLVASIDAHSSGVKKVAISKTGEILSAAYDQQLLVWNPETFELVASLDRPSGIWERSLAWSRDGCTVLAGTFDGGVVAWRVR